MTLAKVLSVLLALALGAPSCQSVDNTNAIELRGLMETVDDSDMRQIDRPLGVGVAFVGMPIREAYVPIAFEFGVQYMHDAGVDRDQVQETSSNLVWLGVRAELDSGQWRPHLGVGLMGLGIHIRRRGSQDFTHQSEQLDSFGLYVEAGLRLRATQHWHLGLGLRQSVGLQDHLDGQATDLDFLEIYGGLGYSF